MDISSRKCVGWHSISAEDAICRLECQASSGLADNEVTAGREKHGRNDLSETTAPKKKIGFLMRLFVQINTVLIYILLAVAIVSGALRDWAKVGLIVGVLNCGSHYWQYRRYSARRCCRC
jgi:magnesium-transporting ATPase (P-type)